MIAWGDARWERPECRLCGNCEDVDRNTQLCGNCFARVRQAEIVNPPAPVLKETPRRKWWLW